jgi:hypothetical protein
MYRLVVKPILPALLAIAGFLIGGLLGLGEPAFGFGWGGIFGMVLGAVIGKLVSDALSHAGL